jgi:ribonuclease G
MVKSMVKNNLLLINTNSPVNRVALVENGNLTELYIDRKKIMSHVGNIYKGRVLRVIPGMQAAFVDIGMEKAAFIYVTDVVGGRIPDKIRLYLLEREDNEEEMEEDAELDFDFSDEENFAPKIQGLL